MDILRISWEVVIQYTETLAKKITDYEPDVIVGLSRGGLVPARILSDVLGVDDVGIIGMRLYNSMGKKSDKPQITQDLTMNLDGKKLLLVDDVADTGTSLIVAKDYLQKKGAKEVRVATIHYKPNSKFKPDYYVMTSTSWIEYPWEHHEIERELNAKVKTSP